MSGADLAELSWFDLSVDDCVLDDAQLRGLRCWGVTVTDTSLRAACLHHAQLGAPAANWPRRSRWERVDASRADLRDTIAEATFQDVTFAHARFRTSQWGWSDLVDCHFAGVVHGLKLGAHPISDRPAGWHLTGVDFSGARLRDVGLVGVDLGTPVVDIRFPSDDDHWRIPSWPDFLDRVAALVERLPAGDDHLTATIWLDYARHSTGPAQREGFIATWDLNHLGGPPLTHLLRQALHA